MLLCSHTQYHNATLHTSDPGGDKINNTKTMNEGNACRHYITPEINKQFLTTKSKQQKD